MRACQIQSAGACWLRASLRTAPSSRLSCGALALTCLGITLLLPLRNTPTSYCSPFEERSTKHLIFSTLSQPGSIYVIVNITGYLLVLLPIPLSIGVAILHSRLWNIDVLINRALVYGTLTGTLVLVYVSSIFVLQFLLREFISLTSAVFIVGSTLAIAALFQPLRHHIQRIIDRHFYRRKYDAARTLAAFTATLRDEVDLSQLQEHLLAVVEETMQPKHVSLWIRQPVQHEKQNYDVSSE